MPYLCGLWRFANAYRENILRGGLFMATTRSMPLHVGKGRTESRAISDIIDYVANPKKTDNGRLITGYACDSRTADAEFLLAKR